MKTNKNLCIHYNFSVEGQTEKQYLFWLEKQINNYPNKIKRVAFNPQIKSPCKMVKSTTTMSKINNFYNVIDIEGQDGPSITEFENKLSNMRKAEKSKKGIKYNLCYSNLSFELWILLHKCNMNYYCGSKSEYLRKINSIFNLNWQNHKELTIESNIDFLLSKLDLSNVIDAVKRAELINTNCTQTQKAKTFAKYLYFKSNPSLSINLVIKEILTKCKII